MAACRAEVPDIPAILRQSAELDGLDVDAALAQLESSLLEFPVPSEPGPDTGQQQDCTLPLFDRNNLYVRHVTDAEAQRLVSRGQAIGLMAAGWDSTRRSDLPWIAVRLVLGRDVIEWSNCAISDTEAHLIAGEEGDTAAAGAARAKLAVWPEIH